MMIRGQCKKEARQMGLLGSACLEMARVLIQNPIMGLDARIHSRQVETSQAMPKITCEKQAVKTDLAGFFFSHAFTVAKADSVRASELEKGKEKRSCCSMWVSESFSVTTSCKMPRGSAFVFGMGSFIPLILVTLYYVVGRIILQFYAYNKGNAERC